MPCRYWLPGEEERYELSEAKKARKKLDELTANECSLSKFIIDLVRLLGYENLTNEQKETYDAMLSKHAQHRELDKRKVLHETEQRIGKLKRDFKQIEKLGGSPKPELVEELKTLKKLKTDVKKSDPLETSLY